MSQSGASTRAPSREIGRELRLWQRLLPWLVTVICFAYLYDRLDQVATAEGSALVPYLREIFGNVRWWRWLALMVPYCMLFLIVDSLIVWRVINWYDAKIGYAEVLPIRASAYILSIVNEQVSKGAIALYMSRRHGVPGWEVGSSMLFIMFCEYYYLLAWATLGVVLQWERFPKVFHAIPSIALASGVFFGVFHLFFSGRLGRGMTWRERPIFRSFRLAKAWHYAAIIALHSPLMIVAVAVYTQALELFGVAATFGDILGYLPVIFFGAATPGPLHSVAILLWVLSFPERPGEMTAFGFVQHNFFIFFNAAIGLLFLQRATRGLFEKAP